MTEPVEKLAKYYRKEPEATNKAILKFLRDSYPDTIVYGARAINAHLPTWLEKETKDWDILTTEDAEKTAGVLEKKLDKRYGGDFFIVEPAQHSGTFRIKSRVTGQVVADVTIKDQTVNFTTIGGVNYTTLEYQEGVAKEILGDPTQKFRHAKDQDTLRRIRVYKATSNRRAKARRARRRSEQYIDGSPVDTSMRLLR